VRAFASTDLVASERDCEVMGQRCVVEGLAARCASDTGTCSPYDPDVNVCEGTTIHLCVQGDRVDLDCANLGKSCEPASPDGASSAHCR
jgi:hypothetical protein